MVLDIHVWGPLRAPASGGLSADSGKVRQLRKLEEIIKLSREKANIKHYHFHRNSSKSR